MLNRSVLLKFWNMKFHLLNATPGILLLLTFMWINDANSNATPKNTHPTPCQEVKIFPKIRAKFHMPIPKGRLDSSTIAVELKSGTEVISIKATNPNLPNFISQYYAQATNIIQSYESKRKAPWLIGPMRYIFSSYYYDFLKEFGLKSSCIGYYAGSTKDFGSIVRVQKLENRLRSLNHTASGTIVRYFDNLKGDDYLRLLGDGIQPVSLKEDSRNNRQIPCDAIFIRSQEGSNLIQLPQINLLPPTLLKIPGFNRIFPTGTKENLVTQLATYYTNGLSCLEQEPLKIAFTSQFANWISIHLLPIIIQSETCLQGFPSILGFLKSLKQKRPVKPGNNWPDNIPQPQKQVWGRMYDSGSGTQYTPREQNQYQQNAYQPPFVPPQGPPENEVHKIVPILIQGPPPLLSSTTIQSAQEQKAMTAGFGYAFLLMFIAGTLAALYYFCYPPSLAQNLKRTRGNMKNWVDKKVSKLIQPKPYFEHKPFKQSKKSKRKAKKTKYGKDHITVRNTESGYTTVTIENESPSTSESSSANSSEELLKSRKSKRRPYNRKRRSRSEIFQTPPPSNNVRSRKNHHSDKEIGSGRRGYGYGRNNFDNYDSTAEFVKKYNTSL